MKVRTFYGDDAAVEGEIERGPTTTSLFFVRMPDGRLVVRARERLTPLDDEARKLLAVPQ